MIIRTLLVLNGKNLFTWIGKFQPAGYTLFIIVVLILGHHHYISD